MGQGHVGDDIFCRQGSIDEAFHQRPWQNIGTLGTEGTIAEDLVQYEADVGVAIT